jgi:RNA polymerase sigma-70 factor (ECF subfamily)
LINQKYFSKSLRQNDIFFVLCVIEEFSTQTGGDVILADSIEQRIKNRDESVYPILIEKYWKVLWVICSAILKNIGTVQDIEECVSDVFIELWENSEKFDPQRANIAVYLKTIARSRAKDFYRRIKPNLAVVSLNDDVEVATDTVSEQVEKQSDLAEVQSAIEKLKEPDKEIFERRHYGGQKPQEIAEAMGLSDRTVRNSLYQSKLKLKNKLGGIIYET